MQMYKYKRGVQVEYNKQGYIYFVSRMYKTLPSRMQDMIDELCRRCGGEHSKALFEFVTTDCTATSVCLKNYVSKSTLYRIVKSYYEAFPLLL